MLMADDTPRDGSQSGQPPVTYRECPPGTSASALAPPDPSWRLLRGFMDNGRHIIQYALQRSPRSRS